MSVWSTKSFEKDYNYIVLQHTLKGVNHIINGIKFRDGYAVVEKDSKTYFSLKKIPVLKASKEYPLTFLMKLPFITRSSDIRTVYGQDVYVKFLNELEKEKKQKELEIEQKREEQIQLKQEVEQKIKEQVQEGNTEVVDELKKELPQIKECCHKTADGTLCKFDSLDYSPSNYCGMHLLEDPRLAEFNLEVPRFMTKEEKKTCRNKVKAELQRAKRAGKF